MRFFFDTEFIESGPDHPLILLSIGIVAQNGAELYLEVSDADCTDANDFVREQVIPHMGKTKGVMVPRQALPAIIYQWVTEQSGGTAPEFWAYYADYDWVLLCQLFGAMVNLPKGWPMYCNDLIQLLKWNHVEREDVPKQEGTAHHALEDARWVKSTWVWYHMTRTGQGH